MNRWIYIAPAAAFLVIAGFLFSGLERARVSPPDILPSALIDKPVPKLTLPALDAQTQGFGPADFTQGKVIVVNVFSSTCIPCRVEAPELDKLAQMRGMTLYGFVWKDKPDRARAFLDELGNPFSRIAVDVSGRAGMEWGIYGWPETYVVDGKGVIRFKYVGALTDQVIAQQLLPAVDKARLAL